MLRQHILSAGQSRWATEVLCCLRMMAGGTLQIAQSVGLAVFWITLTINLISMSLALRGVRRLGHLRLADGSGGALGLELREALYC